MAENKWVYNWGDFTLLYNSTDNWVVSPTLQLPFKVAMTIVAPSVTWCNHFIDLLCLGCMTRYAVLYPYHPWDEQHIYLENCR